MSKDELHQTLDDLHRQLEATGSIDAAAREHLRATMQEIRALLDRSRPAATAQQESGVIERLRGSVQQFEGEHPTLTNTLLELIETLRKIV